MPRVASNRHSGISDASHNGDRLARQITRCEQIAVSHGGSDSILSFHRGGSDSVYFTLTGADCDYLAELLGRWRKFRGHESGTAPSVEVAR